ncbi:hypothetical protein [Hyphobacterium sp.]|uniref:hypothetical protein n=1 Tax=Hyphobacterium sp. TaxID=2004662 RepID=UPI003749955A
MKHTPFTTFRARLIWAAHNARLRFALRDVPRQIRRRVIGDLNSSVREAAATGGLTAALARLGRLDDFLPDLLQAEGISGIRLQPVDDIGNRGRTRLAIGAALFSLKLLAFLSLAAAGFALLGFLAGAFLLPGQFGLHLIGDDEIQLRIFAASSDATSLLGPVLTSFLLVTGVSALALSIRKLGHLSIEAATTLSAFFKPWRSS